MPRKTSNGKNIGGHVAARTPWKSYGTTASIKAALRPGRPQALQDIGQRVVYPRFSSLEARFRTAIDDMFLHTDAYTNRHMKRLFRQAYYDAFQLGKHSAKGGVGNKLPQVMPEDKLWLDKFITKEFAHWQKFLKNRTGRMSPDKRKEMYVQTLRSIYSGAQVISAPPMTVYYWDTTPAEHCPHCLFLKSKSPFLKENLPTLPASGDTKCLSNCRCHLRAGTLSMPKYLALKRKAPTREELLRQMRALSK